MTNYFELTCSQWEIDGCRSTDIQAGAVGPHHSLWTVTSITILCFLYNSTNGEYYQSSWLKTLQTGPSGLPVENYLSKFSFLFSLWNIFGCKYFLIGRRSPWRGWWEPLGVTNVVTMGLLMSFVYPQHLLSLSPLHSPVISLPVSQLQTTTSLTGWSSL